MAWIANSKYQIANEVKVKHLFTTQKTITRCAGVMWLTWCSITYRSTVSFRCLSLLAFTLDNAAQLCAHPPTHIDAQHLVSGLHCHPSPSLHLLHTWPLGLGGLRAMDIQLCWPSLQCIYSIDSLSLGSLNLTTLLHWFSKSLRLVFGKNFFRLKDIKLGERLKIVWKISNKFGIPQKCHFLLSYTQSFILKFNSKNDCCLLQLWEHNVFNKQNFSKHNYICLIACKQFCYC